MHTQSKTRTAPTPDEVELRAHGAYIHVSNAPVGAPAWTYEVGVLEALGWVLGRRQTGPDAHTSDRLSGIKATEAAPAPEPTWRLAAPGRLELVGTPLFVTLASDEAGDFAMCGGGYPRRYTTLSEAKNWAELHAGELAEMGLAFAAEATHEPERPAGS